MRRVTLLFIIIANLLNLGFREYQQPGVDFVDIHEEWKFGEQIRFLGGIQTPAPIAEAVLFIQPLGADTKILNFNTSSKGTINLTFDLTDNPLRAFTPVQYWYKIKLETGEESTSTVFSFIYEDNRFDWQRLESEKFDIAWVSGDLEFGQILMNTAEAGLAAAQTILPVDMAESLRIYVYPSAPELQSAIKLTSLPWAAGHANPDLGVILISIPPGPDARAEMERQIPHEFVHILEYQVLGSSYDRAPMWLLEGLASLGEMYPNPDYLSVLETAVDEDSLVPLAALCETFPRDLSGATLAYAQSTSFVRFLHQNYGSTGIASLLNQYKDGLGCEAGVKAALGSSLAQLEGRWHTETLGRNISLAAWNQIRPYLLLALIILIPVGLSIFPARRKRQKKDGENQ